MSAEPSAGGIARSPGRLVARSPAVPQPAAMQDEAERQARLDRMKRLATLLLIAATLLFVISRLLESRYHWLQIVRATMEAAMVGGIADWFAVTALFRHPLGIPIPHTAIVPAKKDRVGRTLGAFVQRNFLSREVIEHRFRSLRVGARLAEWLADPQNARTISRSATTALSSAAQMLNDDDVQQVIDRSFAKRIRAMRLAPLLGKVLGVMTEDDRHQEVLDEVIELASHTVNENADVIRARIEQETPWWVPTAVDNKIFKRVLGAIQRLLAELSTDRSHPLRQRFDVALDHFVERLNTSPEFAARVDAWKEDFLDNEAARKFSASLWQEGKEALARRAEQAEGSSPDIIEHALTMFGQKALEDPELLAKMDDFAVEVAAFLVSRYQDEVADLIASTVAAWDPELTSRRVELAIGRDLQFIRINGTIVGGLVGMLLYLLSAVV
ncbi:MAG TPA: DUF445 domain-containing protein [Gemmatimonadaceae bacterium]|jgi:uncharacterized membrane-anchored protein YjiN (DUF445 family)|nr:DUF445 domain-containing protein [Gemmatimonadaceae bacterium]